MLDHDNPSADANALRELSQDALRVANEVQRVRQQAPSPTASRINSTASSTSILASYDDR
jgi:hypothetical protein